MEPQKRDLIFAIAAIVLIIALLAWFFIARPHSKLPTASSSSSATSSPSTSGAVADTHAPATKLSQHALYYDIDMEYPSATPLLKTAGAAADAKAVLAMKGFSQNTSDGFIEGSNLNNLSAQDVEIQGLGPDKKYELNAGYKYYSSPSTISYVFTIVEDTLGAHPNTFFRTFTFDAKTGEGLQLGDLFTSPTYLNTISTISRSMLTSTLGNMTDSQTLNAGTSADADNFQNFALDGNNLVIYFPPYQVAAYAAGPQTIKIPVSQLKSILKSQYQ
jgi:hypothetical protein